MIWTLESEPKRHPRVGAAGSAGAAGSTGSAESGCTPAMRTGLDLVRRIYAATAGEAGWQQLADALSAALDGARVVMSLKFPTDSRLRHLYVAGAEGGPACRQADALIDAATGSPDRLRALGRSFSAVAVEPEVPNRVHVPAFDRGVPISSIIAYRTLAEGDFSGEQQALLERLAPHFDRAFDLSRMLLGMAQQSTALAEVMDRLSAAILLLNDSGAVVLKNRAARRILERRDGVGIADGTLRLEDPDCNEVLQARIAEVVAPDAAPDAGGIFVAERRSGAPAYTVSVSRLLPSRSNRDVAACVLVSDPDRGLEPAVDLVRSLHELTWAEAELVAQLARGRTIDEAARSRGVSVNTMRSHLKHVFRKTGTSRQGELVQLVLRSFVPVAEE